MEVTVALVGNPNRQVSYLDAIDAGEGTPYTDLPAVTLDVSLDDSLNDVLGRAAHELGVTERDGSPLIPHWISFYEPSHEQGYSGTGETLYLTLVDGEGRALWGVNVSDPRVTMNALRRAQEAGLIDGDLSRPYLLVRPMVGNGLPFNWDELVQGFEIIRETLGLIADGAGVAVVGAWTRDRVRRIRDRMRRAPDIVQDKSDDWTRRNAWPYGVERLIRSKLWTSEDLARLLDGHVSDVEVLLTARGMVKDQRTGLWHLGEDPESRIANEVYEFGLRHSWRRTNEEGELEKVLAKLQRIVVQGLEPEIGDA
jgi:hypothetical protein